MGFSPLQRNIIVGGRSSQLLAHLFVPQWKSADRDFAKRLSQCIHAPIHSFDHFCQCDISIASEVISQSPSQASIIPFLRFIANFIFFAKFPFIAISSFHRKTLVSPQFYDFITSHIFIAILQYLCRTYIKVSTPCSPPTRYCEHATAVRSSFISNTSHYIASPHIASLITHRYCLKPFAHFAYAISQGPC